MRPGAWRVAVAAALAASGGTATAAPAPSDPLPIRLPSGEVRLVRAAGDERGLTLTALDGSALREAPAAATATRTATAPSALVRSAAPSPRLAVAPAPPRLRLAVVLIEFPDVPHRYEPASFQQLFFSLASYHQTPAGAAASGSVRDYWREVSYGNLSLEGTVLGWVMADHPASSYLAAAGALRAEAVAKSGVDLGQFDALAVVYAGPVQTQQLWPSTLGRWYVAPEQFESTTDVAGIGVHCHELGHVLGLTDLYLGPDSVGDWSLMGTGSRVDAGRTPTHLAGFEKAQLGWVTAPPLGSGAHALAVAAAEASPSIVELVAERSSWFLENRRRVGFDTFVPGLGLLVWRIDGAAAAPTGAAGAVYLVAANGQPAASAGAGAPFPGSSGATALGCSGDPSALERDGSCAVELSAIAASGSQVALTATVRWTSGVGIEVAGAGDYPTLRAALRFAAPGDVVTAPPGRYAEQVRLAPGVALVGAGPGRSLIATAEPASLVVAAEGSALDGFTLEGDGQGRQIGVDQALATAFAVSHAVLTGFDTGVAVAEAWPPEAPLHTRQVRVENCVFAQNGTGVLAAVRPGGAQPVVRDVAFLANGRALASDAVADGADYLALWQNGVDLAVPAPAPAHLVTADPRFVDPAAGDFRLAARSPLVDAGDPDPAYRDADGSRGDIGAFGGAGFGPKAGLGAAASSGASGAAPGSAGAAAGGGCGAGPSGPGGLVLLAAARARRRRRSREATSGLGSGAAGC